MEILPTVPRKIVTSQDIEDAHSEKNSIGTNGTDSTKIAETTKKTFLETMNDNLHYIYLLIMIPIALCLTLTIAPFQQADGYDHYLRAEQLSHGQLFGYIGSEHLAGGDIDINLSTAMNALGDIPFHYNVKLTVKNLHQCRTCIGQIQLTLLYFPIPLSMRRLAICHLLWVSGVAK